MTATEEVKIDKRVAVPVSRRNRYPFAALEVGDSFFIPAEPQDAKGLTRLQAVLGTCARQAAKRMPGREFTTRRMEEKGVRGIRVWRME